MFNKMRTSWLSKGIMSLQSTSLVSHARALWSFNTVGLHRHHDYAQLFEHFIKKIHSIFVYCWVRKARWNLQVHDRKARNSLFLLLLFFTFHVLHFSHAFLEFIQWCSGHNIQFYVVWFTCSNWLKLFLYFTGLC